MMKARCDEGSVQRRHRPRWYSAAMAVGFIRFYSTPESVSFSVSFLVRRTMMVATQIVLDRCFRNAEPERNDEWCTDNYGALAAISPERQPYRQGAVPHVRRGIRVAVQRQHRRRNTPKLPLSLALPKKWPELTNRFYRMVFERTKASIITLIAWS